MIRIEIDGNGFKRAIKRYADKKHASGESVIMELAAECSKGLASRVQPWGLKVAKMKKFQGSIRKQASRAVKNANVVGNAATAAQAHSSRRNNQGQVPTGLRTQGQYKQKPISIQDRIDHGNRKAKVAGAAKGGWLDCARKCFQRVKFPAFFRQLLNHGSFRKTGKGLNTTVFITNELDYIQKTMKPIDVATGVKQGYTAMIGKIKRALK